MSLSHRFRGKLGGSVTNSRYSGAEITRASHQAQWRAWLDRVDPERQLSEQERAKRARNARRERMLRLSMLSARVRREKNTGGAA